METLSYTHRHMGIFNYLPRDIYLPKAIKIPPATGDLLSPMGDTQLVQIVTVPSGDVRLAPVRICISKSPCFALRYRISRGKKGSACKISSAGKESD